MSGESLLTIRACINSGSDVEPWRDTLRVCRVLAGSHHHHAIVWEFTDLPFMLRLLF
jgi:hypothetical protein